MKINRFNLTYSDTTGKLQTFTCEASGILRAINQLLRSKDGVKEIHDWAIVKDGSVVLEGVIL